MIKQAKFVKSSSEVGQCPEPRLPEYAFIGRSNVGKSSLINALTNQKHLAMTSSRPGKTQLINHYLIDEKWYLVDLPGYGYAKVDKTKKAQLSKMIEKYITGRLNLMCLFVLIDIRLEPQPVDLSFLQWVGAQGIPLALVFTKSDKLGESVIPQQVALFEKAFLEEWEEMPAYFVTSAEKRKGLEGIEQLVKDSNPLFVWEAQKKAGKPF